MTIKICKLKIFKKIENLDLSSTVDSNMKWVKIDIHNALYSLRSHFLSTNTSFCFITPHPKGSVAMFIVIFILCCFLMNIT